MESRKKDASNALALALKDGQNQVAEGINFYLSDYAKERVWEQNLDYREITEPNIVKRVSLWAVKQQLEGGRALIPDEILENLKNNTYIKIGSHLFYFEKTRNKITEKAIPPEKLARFKKFKKNEALNLQEEANLNLKQEIQDLFGETPKGDVVSTIKDTDPPQIQFCKHALLALQEAEDLVSNLEDLVLGMSKYTQKETAAQDAKEQEPAGNMQEAVAPQNAKEQGPAVNMKKEAPAQAAKDRGLVETAASHLLNLSAQLDIVYRGYGEAKKLLDDKTTEDTSFAKAAAKLALQRASQAIDDLHLRTAFEVTKPIQQSILWGLLSSAAIPTGPAAGALYGVVNTVWYAGVGLSMIKPYQTARDFMIANRDNILRPWQKLYSHCEDMIKIAEEAKLSPETIQKLKALREKMSQLCDSIGPTTVKDPKKLQKLHAQLAEVGQELATIMSTYLITPAPALKAEDLYEFELTHHLRPGVVSEHLGLEINEPKLQTLQAKYQKACNEHEAVKSNYADIKKLSDNLLLYQLVGKQFTEGDSAWRKAGYSKSQSFIQKAALAAWTVAGYTPSKADALTPEQFVENIAFLLRELARMKTKGFFKSPEALEAVAVLEDQLIKHLSLKEKYALHKELLASQSDDSAKQADDSKIDHHKQLRLKLYRAFLIQNTQEAELNKKGLVDFSDTMVRDLSKEEQLAKPWPPQELTAVLTLVDREKKSLAEQLLEQEKYQEALAFYEKLKAKQGAQVPPSPTAMTPAINKLKNTRETLAHKMKHLFSEYANTTFLKNNELAEKDPVLIKFSKQGLGILQDAETLARKMETFLIAFKTNKMHAALIFSLIASDLTILVEHIKNMIKLAKELGLENEATITELSTISASLSEALVKISKDPKQVQALLSKKLEKISALVTTVASPLMSTPRPSAPSMPEQKYLRPVAESIAPEGQAKNEWFPLIEHVRAAMGYSQNLHNALEKFMQDAKAEGIGLDPKEEKLIEDTLAALKNSKIDQQGYFDYSNTETPFSRSLKALFNASWALNESVRGFSEHSGALSLATAIAQGMKHSPKLLEHLGQIQWAELGNHSNLLANQLMNAFLVYSEKEISPFFKQFSDFTHQIELKNDLRFGVLSEPIRPFLDPLEQAFHARKLRASANPFSYDVETEIKLEAALEEAKIKVTATFNAADENYNADTVLKHNKAIQEYSKIEDAIQEHQKMRQAFAIRCLQGEGIITMMEAVRSSQANENQNIEQKRKLAIVLADINFYKLANSREAYLAHAHQRTTEFLNDPHQIKELIEKVISIDLLTGQALALEATLAGYLEFNPAYFLPKMDKDTQQRNLIKILGRLEARQLLLMLDQGNSTAIAVFLTCLGGEPLTSINVEEIKNLISAPSEETEKERFLLRLYARYTILQRDNSPENQVLMNKLALFIGHLACADKELAKSIFADEARAAILKEECKDEKNTALYYEAMVNTFDYDFTEKKHELENRTANKFIDANRETILKVYKTISLANKHDDAIIEACKNNPLLLLEWIDKFITEKTSKNSAAAESLSEFCSAFMLCSDNQVLRQHLLTQQQKEHGGQTAGFLALLTPEASPHFWEQVRENLKTASHEELDTQLAHFLTRIASNEDLNEIQKNKIREEALQFTQEQQSKLVPITDKLKSKGQTFVRIRHLFISKNNNYITECRYVVQEINTIKESLTKKFQKLEQEPFQRLAGQLKEIDRFFADYLKEREDQKTFLQSSGLNSALGEFGLKSKRPAKIQLAIETREKFQELSEQLQKAIDAPEKASKTTFQFISNQAIEIITDLRKTKLASGGELRKTVAKAEHSLFPSLATQKKTFAIHQLLEILKEIFIKPKKDHSMTEGSRRKV